MFYDILKKIEFSFFNLCYSTNTCQLDHIKVGIKV